ncbi:MAG: hypothetical protein IKU94_10780, partial [Bacteroidaceae bacterium]|nr:hypothetical protein [Bacteroidaceae bacterium]
PTHGSRESRPCVRGGAPVGGGGVVNPSVSFADSSLFRDTQKIRAAGDGFLAGGAHAARIV